LIRRPPRSTLSSSSAASDVYKRQPYTDERLKSNFRLNAFFIGNNTRTAINAGLADYTPIFLSQVPDLFNRRIISIDIALIQTSLPDRHGFLLSLIHISEPTRLL